MRTHSCGPEERQCAIVKKLSYIPSFRRPKPCIWASSLSAVISRSAWKVYQGRGYCQRHQVAVQSCGHVYQSGVLIVRMLALNQILVARIADGLFSFSTLRAPRSAILTSRYPRTFHIPMLACTNQLPVEVRDRRHGRCRRNAYADPQQLRSQACDDVES